jgi:hypothetical protein
MDLPAARGRHAEVAVLEEGIECGQLVFLQVRDLQPEALLSPQRGRRMTLEPQMVASVAVDGRTVWPQ